MPSQIYLPRSILLLWIVSVGLLLAQAAEEKSKNKLSLTFFPLVGVGQRLKVLGGLD